eukprot:EC787523.1.p2 GENE.EC787523.1~~EC787523.1.p2  ORF type:complete len:106 (-),score=14.07 EC787523.1:22-339(-)
MSISQRGSLQLQAFSVQLNSLLQSTAILETCGNIVHGRQRVWMLSSKKQSSQFPAPSEQCLSMRNSLVKLVVHSSPMQSHQRVRMIVTKCHTLPLMTLHQQRQIV